MKYSHLFISSLVAVVLAGTFLRVWNLGDQSYWMDEGITIVAVDAIRETGSQVLASGFKYTCEMYCFPTALLVTLFGESPAMYRLVSALAGMLFVIFFFFGVKRIFNSRIALLATFFASFSYFQIAWSRQARWYTLFELFFWVALFCFYQALYGTRRTLYAGLTLVFTLLAAFTHELGYVLPLIFGAWLALHVYIQHKPPLLVTAGITLAGVGFITGLGLYLGASPSFSLPFYAHFYLREYWLLVLLSIFAFVHPWNRYKKESGLLVVTSLAYIVPLSFLSDIVNYRYLFHVTPVLFVLAALGTFAVLSDIPKQWQRGVALVAIVALFLLSGQGVLVPQTHYFLESDNPESILLKNRNSFLFVPQPNWAGAYAVITRERSADDIVITSQPAFNQIYLDEPGYWIRYSYNGKNYMPETEDGREFYVGARIVPDATAFAALVEAQDGYLVIDSYGLRRLAPELQQQIEALPVVFEETTNAYSRVYVYRI